MIDYNICEIFELISITLREIFQTLLILLFDRKKKKKILGVFGGALRCKSR